MDEYHAGKELTGMANQSPKKGAFGAGLFILLLLVFISIGIACSNKNMQSAFPTVSQSNASASSASTSRPAPDTTPTPAAVDSLVATARISSAPVPENGTTTVSKATAETAQVNMHEYDSEFYLLKFISSSEPDQAATVFLYPYSKVSVSIPAGAYRILYAKGITWYGEINLFGPETVYGEITGSFQLNSGSIYTFSFTTPDQSTISAEAFAN